MLTASVAVVLLTVSFVFFISLRQWQRVKDTGELVDHTESVLDHIQKTVLAALDNETGARGYVITGRPEFLEPLERSVINFNKELKSLRSLLSSDLQIKRLDTLDQYANKRIRYSDSMVLMRNKFGINGAYEMVSSGRGKAFTDEIRRLAADLEQTGREQLAVRKKANNQSITTLNIILYCVLGIVMVLSAYFIRHIRKEIKTRTENEQKFISLLDAAPDATVIVDKNGQVKMVNHQTESLFGYKRDELVGQSVEALVPPEKRGVHQQHRGGFMKAAAVRAMGTGIELFAVRKDGSRFPAEISLSPIVTEEGMWVSAAVRDISGRKKLEDELRKTNSELEAFTYSVSHDLRAPLRGIIGFAAILEEDYTSKLDDEALRITGIIKSNTVKMGHLIDDLLGFSRMGRTELMKISVDMNELVQQVVADLQPVTAQPPHWYIEKLPVVRADLNTMRQVWVNLISNALKYSARREEPQITIGFYRESRENVFFIKDNGVGFDAKYKEKLFRVFQRLHSAEEFEGTGVGLALVEKIISKHGGRVWAEGELNRGASFYFSIPDE